MLLWLWHRLVAAAFIHLLAQELPRAAGAALNTHTHTTQKTLLGEKYCSQWTVSGFPVFISFFSPSPPEIVQAAITKHHSL